VTIAAILIVGIIATGFMSYPVSTLLRRAVGLEAT